MDIEVILGLIEFYPVEGDPEEDSMITLIIDYDEESLLKQLENKRYHLEFRQNVVTRIGLRYVGDNYIDSLEEQNYRDAMKDMVKNSLQVVDEDYKQEFDLEDMTVEEIMAKIGIEDDMGTVG